MSRDGQAFMVLEALVKPLVGVLKYKQAQNNVLAQIQHNYKHICTKVY